MKLNQQMLTFSNHANQLFILYNYLDINEHETNWFIYEKKKYLLMKWIWLKNFEKKPIKDFSLHNFNGKIILNS